MDLQQLKREALKRPWRERLELAQHLLQSLHQLDPRPAPVDLSEAGSKKIVLDGSVAESFERLRKALESSLEP